MACDNFRPDHNGECLNCDEWADAHKPLKRGDFVIIKAHGAQKEAMVSLASPNGRSIMVMFEGGLFWPSDEGGYAGIMPLFQQDDGTWIELINQRPIKVERVPRD